MFCIFACSVKVIVVLRSGFSFIDKVSCDGEIHARAGGRLSQFLIFNRLFYVTAVFTLEFLYASALTGVLKTACVQLLEIYRRKRQ
ncbi:MAG: hypothetical protein QNJ56_11035 [Gammaproteobacteria bacterium]|nr:hypothetical protein [Gammaproteobacteria bacterium]